MVGTFYLVKLTVKGMKVLRVTVELHADSGDVFLNTGIDLNTIDLNTFHKYLTGYKRPLISHHTGNSTLITNFNPRKSGSSTIVTYKRDPNTNRAVNFR